MQHQLFGLGNFINLTPAIKGLADYFDCPIPVYFELDHVRQCFTDCDFIEILDEKPFNRELFGSWMVDGRNRLPDWAFVYMNAAIRYNISPEMPHTYIDQASEIKIDEGNYNLFMYGSGNEDSVYMSKKTPDQHHYTDYMYQGLDIFTGSTTDFNRVTWFNHMPHYLDNIRKSIALIREADLIITNDTGLAHASGAMNKEVVILWKHTLLPKNGNPGLNTTIKLVE